MLTAGPSQEHHTAMPSVEMSSHGQFLNQEQVLAKEAAIRERGPLGGGGLPQGFNINPIDKLVTLCSMGLETFEEAEDYWMTFFLHEPKYKTKVIGKTIIYWPVEKKEAA